MKAVRRGVLRALVIAPLALGLSAGVALADYLMQPGDAVRVYAAGIPEFDFTATVGIDGAIDMPLVGTVAAAGRDIGAVKDEIRRTVADKVLTRRLGNGEEADTVVEPGEISVAIASYRPVYVDGDVSKPGELAFRPGLTVRQAMAGVGGVSIVRRNDEEPSADIARLGGEYEDGRTRLAALLVERARVLAELGGKTSFDVPDRSSPVDAALMARLAEVENEVLASNTQKLAADGEALDKALDNLGERLGFLKARREKEEAAEAADTEYQKSLQENFKRGLVPTSRVAEAERIALASAARVQEVSASIAQTSKELIELSRQKAVLGEARHVELLERSSVLEGEIHAAEARLRSLAEEMLFKGAAPNRLLDPKRDATITIHRAGVADPIAGNPATVLMPGDVVEVELAPFAADARSIN